MHSSTYLCTHKWESKALLCEKLVFKLMQAAWNRKDNHVTVKNLILKMCLIVSGSTFMCLHRCVKTMNTFFFLKVFFSFTIWAKSEKLFIYLLFFRKLGHKDFWFSFCCNSENTPPCATDERRAELNLLEPEPEHPHQRHSIQEEKSPAARLCLTGLKLECFSVKHKTFKLNRPDCVEDLVQIECNERLKEKKSCHFYVCTWINPRQLLWSRAKPQKYKFTFF